MAHKCIEARLRQKIPGLVWKLDMEKAYDSVNWSCLEEVMCCMDSGRKWRDWIGYFVSSAHFLVLVNGCLKVIFACGCGLR